MDLTMPVMSGLQACRLLKKDKKTKNIPVLVIKHYPVKAR